MKGDEPDLVGDDDNDAFQFLNDVDQEQASADSDASADADQPPVAAPSPAVEARSPARPEPAAARPTGDGGGKSDVLRVSRRAFHAVIGYTIVLTVTVLFLMVTGRVSFRAEHPLESLPDLRPLPDNEFLRVPPDAELPDGHVLMLGESRRFGDIVLTPAKVTFEPLQFQGFLTADIDPALTTPPVLKLWLQFENAADDYAFPPLDAWLLASRSPPDGIDDETAANSFLSVASPEREGPLRVLNYLHLPDSNFQIVGQNAGAVVKPGEQLTAFIPSGIDVPSVDPLSDEDFRWRIQIRKGVGPSGSGVTTLVDVLFTAADVEFPKS